MALSEIGLVCPHCGHDGKRATSRTQLGSWGFNYLTESLVSREVSGCDATGRLRLSPEFRWQPSNGVSAKFECRACWHTFPIPDGLPLPTSSDGSPSPLEATAGHAAAPAGALNADPRVLEKLEELRETIVRLATDTRERAESLEAANREAAQARNWLGEVIAQLEVGQQATRQRLEAQADSIRGLQAATEEQKTGAEELRAAVQRLEASIAAIQKAEPRPKSL